MAKSPESSGIFKHLFELNPETKKHLGHIAVGALVGAGIILSF